MYLIDPPFLTIRQIISFHSLGFFGIMSTTGLCAVHLLVPIFTWTFRRSPVKTGVTKAARKHCRGSLLKRKIVILVPDREQETEEAKIFSRPQENISRMNSHRWKLDLGPKCCFASVQICDLF